MKKIFSIILGAISSLPLQTLQAGPHEIAQEAVLASMVEAQAKAMTAVSNDFNSALSEMLSELYQTDNLDNYKKIALTEQADLLKRLEAIANVNPTEVASNRAEVNRIYNDYVKAVQNRFNLSFYPAQARFDARKSLIFASRAFSIFEGRCQSGRGLGDPSPLFDYPDMPQPQYSIYMSVGNGGAPSGSGYYIGTGSQAEKDRNTATNAALTVMSIDASIMATGGSAGAVSVATAAAPYVMAGGVVVALGAMYLSHQERVKAENEIVDAKIYAFHNSATDIDIGRYYREHCESMSDSTAKIRVVLDQAANNIEEFRRRSVSSDELDKQIEKYAALIREHDEAMRELKRLSEEVLKHDGDQSVKDQVIAQAQKIKVLDKKIADKSSPDMIAKMMTQFILTKQTEIETTFSNLSWDVVNELQDRAFHNILAVIRIVQKRTTQAILTQNGIEEELKADQLFQDVRLMFRKMIAMKIKFIFDRVSVNDVKNSATLLQDKSEELFNKYGHLNTVANLTRQIRELLEIQ